MGKSPGPPRALYLLVRGDNDLLVTYSSVREAQVGNTDFQSGQLLRHLSHEIVEGMKPGGRELGGRTERSER
jgi:hypothetical protein